MLQSASTLIVNIGDLVTCEPLARHKKLRAIGAADLGRLSQAWLLIAEGKVQGFGPMPPPAELVRTAGQQRDAGGQLLMPGLIDSHSHLLFAGSRSLEFAQRLEGKSYQEIAAAGGGIQATMRASRAASQAELLRLAQARLARFLRHGVTSLEVKSGYGLAISEELRHLEVLRELRRLSRQTLRISCLALHARSPEYPTLAAYAAAASAELLPEVARRGLADYVDAFIEGGYFTVADCEPYMRQATTLGLGIRLHADEFSDAGAAEAAARWQAASADHLQFASSRGIAAMAEAGVVATLLPGTSLYTAIPFCQGRRFADAGCPIAVASDYNPGSCAISNLPLLASLAGLHCGLKPAEIIAGVTYVAAHSLGLQADKGALAPGMAADFFLHPAASLEGWLADCGESPASEVWIAGERLLGASS